MKKIFVVFVVIFLLFLHVYERSKNIEIYRRVKEYEKKLEILKQELEELKIELAKEMLFTEIEKKARKLGMVYPWEENENKDN